MKFSTGQEVTPNKRKFHKVVGPKDPVMPTFGEIYHVVGYHSTPYQGRYFLWLYEMPWACIYCEDAFSPVITDNQLAEALKEIELQEVSRP